MPLDRLEEERYEMKRRIEELERASITARRLGLMLRDLNVREAFEEAINKIREK